MTTSPPAYKIVYGPPDAAAAAAAADRAEAAADRSQVNENPFFGAMVLDGTRNVVQFVKDTGILWEVPRSAMSNVTPFTWTQGTYPFTQGPPGETNYNNDVVAWGFNIIGPNSKVVTGQPAGWFSFESKFYQGGRWLSEFHLSHSGADNSEVRLFSFVADHAGGWSNGSFALTEVVWAAPGRSPAMQWNFLTDGQGRLFLENGTRLVGTTNNIPVAQQKNAAGSADIPLPYVNASDQIQFDAPLYFVGAVSGSTPCLSILPLSGLVAGQALIQAQGTLASAGNIDLLNGVLSVNGMLRTVIQNNGNHTGAGAQLLLTALYGASGADTSVVWENVGVGGTGYAFSAGIDQSAGAWKLSANSSLGSNDRITVNSSAVAMGLPARMPSYTVAGVPSASASGAGAMVYVSNESGGAVIAFSDGTNWRRVTDRAVIS